MSRVRTAVLVAPLLALALLALTFGARPVVAEPPKAARFAAKDEAALGPVVPAIEPRAIELLKAMSARLAAARTLSFTATTTYESPSRIGPPLAYTTVSEVTVQRPDKFRVVTPGDGPASEIYDDGKTLLAYAPAEGLVAVADAPPTIDDALRLLFESAAIYYPFTDVIVADPYGDIAEGIEIAFVVGQSHVVGGTTTDIVAMAVGRSFQQVWIGAEDKLPRRIRAVYAHDPSRLRHEVELSGWKVDGEVPDGAFTSAAATAARQIPFAPPEPKPPVGAKQVPPSKPAKSKP
jgi:hypothetical protein